MTTATLTLVHDRGPHGDGLFHVNVQVADLDLDLGAYTTLSDAAQRMGNWVRQRGMAWCPDTAARLDACTATDGPVLVLNARTISDWAFNAQAWHRVDYYPYVHVAHRMGC